VFWRRATHFITDRLTDWLADRLSDHLADWLANVPRLPRTATRIQRTECALNR
jgi:hypothetical protein